ncbi:MAG: imidazoleglycerol-phosphate dehydratase [Chloroflexi bacterium]|nr:imidazoleglycerol-phosphate dehydratase [Chloroflexota bacterium]
MTGEGAAAPRQATVRRETRETVVDVSINIDGRAQYDVSTGSLMLNHLIDQLGRHSGFDLTVRAEGLNDPDGHHTAEDTGIVIGRALGEALGDRTGIRRMAHETVPLDDALTTAVVDLGGRGYAAIGLQFSTGMMGDLRTELVAHVLESIAREGRINLHVVQHAGVNDHHIAEATFKALAKALDTATRRDERFAGVAPSTKGTLTD